MAENPTMWNDAQMFQAAMRGLQSAFSVMSTGNRHLAGPYGWQSIALRRDALDQFADKAKKAAKAEQDEQLREALNSLFGGPPPTETARFGQPLQGPSATRPPTPLGIGGTANLAPRGGPIPEAGMGGRPGGWGGITPKLANQLVGAGYGETLLKAGLGERLGTKSRPTAKDAEGYLRYLDTKERVFENAVKPAKQPVSRKITKGHMLFTEEWDPKSKTWRTIATAPRWAPGEGGSLSISQQKINEEILRAREMLAAQPDLTRDTIVARTQRQTDTGMENREFNPYLAEQVRRATSRLYGKDPDYPKVTRRYLGKVPVPTPAPEDILTEFNMPPLDELGAGPERAADSLPSRQPSGPLEPSAGPAITRPIGGMSLEEISDLVEQHGNSLAPAELEAISRRLSELNIR